MTAPDQSNNFIKEYKGYFVFEYRITCNDRGVNKVSYYVTDDEQIGVIGASGKLVAGSSIDEVMKIIDKLPASGDSR